MPGIQRRGPAYYAAAGVEQVANAAGVMDDPALARGLWQRFKTAPELRKAIRPALAGAAALGGIEGAAKSIKDQYNGERERWMQRTLGRQPESLAGTLGMDTLRVLENVGNATLYGLPGKIGGALGNAAYDVHQGLRRRL